MTIREKDEDASRRSIIGRTGTDVVDTAWTCKSPRLCWAVALGAHVHQVFRFKTISRTLLIFCRPSDMPATGTTMLPDRYSSNSAKTLGRLYRPKRYPFMLSSISDRLCLWLKPILIERVS